MASRRPRRSNFMRVKKPATTSYISVLGTSLAASTTANYSILLANDSPNKALVTDMASVVAHCENNSTILRRGSFLHLNFLGTTVPAIVTVWLYMNSKGLVTAPTDGNDFSSLPQTEDNAQLREKTIFYRQVPLSSSEFRGVRIPLGGRRNNHLVDGSILVLVIHNRTAAGAIQWSGYGRIRTIEG